MARAAELGASRIAGALAIEASPAKLTGCRSGDALGFFGVEATLDTGQRLRLAQGLDGGGVAVLFAPGAERGQTLSEGATVRVLTTGLRVDGVRVVEGSAKLACDAPLHVSGTVEFRCGR